MLILLEGPDDARTTSVADAIRYYHETFLEVWPDAVGPEAPLDPIERFRVPGYERRLEPSVILRGWHWTTVVASPDPPFSFRDWKRLESHLGKRGALAVYVEPPEPDERWDIVVNATRLPIYRVAPEASLRLVTREVLALAHLLSERSGVSETPPPRPAREA